MDKIKASINEFLDEIKDKKLYCYGGGKVFKDFLCVCPGVEPYAVIDKNSGKSVNDMSGKQLRVISADEFIAECDEKAVLLITCFDYQEVEDEFSHFTKLTSLPYYVYCQMSIIQKNNDLNSSSRFQITEFRMQDYNAGNKAPTDVAKIAVENGYQALAIMRGTVKNGEKQTHSEWVNLCNEITNNAMVLVQFPMLDISGGIYELISLNREKNVRIICVIHDIEILRRNVTDTYVEQYNMLKTCADIWIVHNKRMKEILVSRGFQANRIVSLEIFDYLIQNPVKVKKDDGIIIAGNLDKSKSEYIYHLNEIKKVKFNLFGANYSDENVHDNIRYFGTFLPDELIQNLQGMYGLVWDGKSLDTCSGLTGEYLKVNNPHKLSLYLAVGLPVIIWEEAAEAEFVLNEHVGIAVKSLYELPDKLASMSENDYEVMKKNAAMVGERLRKGMYMTNAIKEAEKKIKEMETKNGV